MNTHRESLGSMLVRQAAERGEAVAVWRKQAGEFVSVDWRTLAEAAARVAGGLRAAGVSAGERVLQVSENRFEWLVADLAIHWLGAVHVPVHATLTGPQIDYQIRHSEARVVLLSTLEQARKLLGADGEWPYRAGGHEAAGFLYDHGESLAAPDLRPWSELANAAPIAAAEVAPESLATILYTSGTTGEPKGVMLTHRNLVTNVRAMTEILPPQPGDVRLGLLPLSHIFARTCDLYTTLWTGVPLALAESRESVFADAVAIRPTVLNAVPYFWDKAMRLMIEHGASVAELLGGRLRYGVSGGAALPAHVFDFFREHGLLLLQGYGLTESAPTLAASTEAVHRRGTVGRAVPGVELRLADDGELLARGPNVMPGYWKNAAATAESIRDGWLHTGDLASFDADGQLRITGRKKELIVTASGKNIAPVYLESLLLRDPLLKQAVVIGDGRNYLTALLVVDCDRLRSRLGSTASDADLLADRAAEAVVADIVRTQLADVSPQEQVRKFALLAQPFTLEGGELTPKLSLRRPVIEARLRARIEALYQG